MREPQPRVQPAIPLLYRRLLRWLIPHTNAIAPVATIQVAASVIVTAVLTPILTAWMYRKVQKERGKQAGEVDIAAALSGEKEKEQK